MPSPFTRDQLSPQMQARYGLDHRPVGRRIAVTAIIALFVGALAYVAVGVTSADVQSRLLGWDAIDADHVDITFDIDRAGTDQVTCVLRAQDKSRIDLGYATVEIPPGPDHVSMTYSLRTIAPAYTAELLGCAVGGPPRVIAPQFPPGVVPPDQPYTVG